MCVKSLSRVRLFATLGTVAHQAPLSMGFSRQEYTGVGYHFLFQGVFLTQELNPPPALAGRFFTIESPGKLW